MQATHALWAAVVLIAEASAAGFVGWRVSGWAVQDGGSASLRLVVALLVWWCQIVGVQLLCGAVFLLYPPVVLALHALIALTVWRRVPRVLGRAGEPDDRLAVGALTGFISFALVLDGRLSMSIPTDIDDVQYHMANAAQWVQSHNIWHIPAADPGYFTNGYPSNGELVTTWVMGPLSGAEWSAVPSILFGATILVAGAFLAEELGGRAWNGMLGSAAILLCPMLASEFGHASTDWTSIGALMIAVGLLLHGRGSGLLRWYALAGLALGLAIGSKDTALGPGLTLILVAALLPPRGKRMVPLAAMSVGVVFLGAFWFVRDWIQLGDPIYPESVRVAGHTIFGGASGPLTAFSTSLMSDVLRGSGSPLVLWLEFFGAWVGLAALPLLGGLVGWRGASFRFERRLVLALAVVWFAIYMTEPYTGPGKSPLFVLAQIRYGLAAVALAVVWGCVSSRWGVIVAWIGLAADAVDLIRPPIHIHQYGPYSPGRFDATVTATAVILGIVAGGLVVIGREPITSFASARLVRRAGVLVAPALATAALGVSAARHVPAATPLDRFLSAAGRSHGPVMVDMVYDVLQLMGPQLTHPIVSAGGLDRGEQIPLLTVPQLDARLAATGPDAVVEGPPVAGFDIAWDPPGYRLLSMRQGVRVYVKASISDVRVEGG